MKKRAVAALLAGGLAVFLAACGSASKADKSSETAQIEKSYGTEDEDGEGEGRGADADPFENGDDSADSREQLSQAADGADEQEEQHSSDDVPEVSEAAEAGTQADADDPTAQDDAPPADPSQSDPDETAADPRSIQVSSPEDGVKLLEAVYGTEDDETGNAYSFQYLDTFTIEGEEFYGYRWSWLVDGGHKSKVSDILVQTDGSAVYQGNYNGEEWDEVYFEDNQLS